VYPFSSSPSQPILNYSFEECGFHPFFFPSLYLCCETIFLIGKLIISIACFISLDLIFVL
jgi:hypothetical protein